MSFMANFIGGIFNITLGAVLIATVFITTIKNTNTSTWTAGEIAMWGFLSLAGIMGLVYGTLQVFGLA
jgi:hypothetical protein